MLLAVFPCVAGHAINSLVASFQFRALTYDVEPRESASSLARPVGDGHCRSNEVGREQLVSVQADRDVPATTCHCRCNRIADSFCA